MFNSILNKEFQNVGRSFYHCYMNSLSDMRSAVRGVVGPVVGVKAISWARGGDIFKAVWY